MLGCTGWGQWRHFAPNPPNVHRVCIVRVPSELAFAQPDQIPNRCTPLLLALPLSKRAAGHLGYLSSIRATMASAADDDVDGDSLSAQGARKARAVFLCLIHNPVYEAHTLSSQ